MRGSTPGSKRLITCSLKASRPLETVRKQYLHCVIGAVTNGRGDPRGMPSLATLFDFCVSGEDEDVWPERKPSPEIYEHAFCRALSSSSLSLAQMHLSLSC